MMSSNQNRKFYPCRGGCGAQIFSDNYHKSDSGKAIPLELDSLGQPQPHNCPNRQKQRQQHQHQHQQYQQQRGDTANDSSSTIALLRTLIEEQRSGFERLNSRLDNLYAMLETLSSPSSNSV